MFEIQRKFVESCPANNAPAHLVPAGFIIRHSKRADEH